MCATYCTHFISHDSITLNFLYSALNMKLLVTEFSLLLCHFQFVRHRHYIAHLVFKIHQVTEIILTNINYDDDNNSNNNNNNNNNNEVEA
jgi:hypothetical protein